MKLFPEAWGILRADLAVWAVLLPVLGLFLQRVRRARIERLRSLGAGGYIESSAAGTVCPIVFSALLFGVLLRPYAGYEEFRVATQGSSFMAVVDVSLSMHTRDASPDRLAAVVRKLDDLISLLQERASAERLGLVVFAGGSYVLCPLTSDYSILRMYVRSLSSDLLSSEGSGINGALETALRSLRDSGSLPARILLLSDGEDNYFDARRAASLFEGGDVRLDILGFGTAEGRPIETESGRFLSDLDGNIVISRLNEDLLATLAQFGRGRYLPAALDDSDLRAIVPAPASRQATEGAPGIETVRVYNEIGPLIVMVLLFALLLLYARAGSRIIFPLMIVLVAAQPLQAAEAPSLYDSYRAYQQGDYDRALSGFEAGHRQNPGDLSVLQALASTLYRLERYAEASQFYARAAELAKSRLAGRESFENLYNGANADFMDGRFASAIRKYEESLSVKENDPAALHNLELARRRLAQEEASREPKEDRQQDENRDRQEQSAGQDERDTDKPDAQQEQSADPQPAQPWTEPGPEAGQSPETSDKNPQEMPGQSGEMGHKAAGQDPDNADSPGGSERAREAEEQALKEYEARQWLESLDDSPLILGTRKQSKDRVNPQSW